MGISRFAAANGQVEIDFARRPREVRYFFVPV
jgi:hypothetical protein